MLISFTTRNYKSIKDETTLHLGVDNLDGIHSNNIAYPDKDSKIPVLRSAGIWGPNASGKSNLLDALEALQDFVVTSHRNELDQPIEEYRPFKLNPISAHAPVYFELDFIGRNQEHYIYAVEFLNNSVVYECLEFYGSTKPSTLFKRKMVSGKLEIKFGQKLSGTKAIACLDNQGYLSVAANDKKSSTQIKDVFRYIKNDINILSPDSRMFSSGILTHENYLKSLGALLSCADTGIDTVKAKEEDFAPKNLPSAMPEELKKKIMEDFKWKPKFFHNNTDIEFSNIDESAGTMRLYHIAPMIIIGLNTSDTWVLDEIECRLHPQIVEFIIRLFHEKAVNKKNPQLIFTCHNAALMNSDLFRREQIWLTQKNTQGATELTCLDEYNQIRADTNFEKWYREGRFEAIPDVNYTKLRDVIVSAANVVETEEANNE